MVRGFFDKQTFKKNSIYILSFNSILFLHHMKFLSKNLTDSKHFERLSVYYIIINK